MNDCFQALATLSSGNSAPGTIYPYQYWVDTGASPALLKQRNGANTAWITLGRAADVNVTALYVNNAEAARFDSTGRLGIGITSPAYKLDVDGDINVTGSLRINGTAIGDVADDSITFAKIQNVAANSVVARVGSSGGDLSAVPLSPSTLFGRGASGNVAPIALGAGLSMVGDVLTPTSTATGQLLARTVFTASGTWNKSTNNPSSIIVEVQAPGGGEGGSASNGGTGGTTSFGSHVSCTGGAGSGPYVTGRRPGAAGGTATGADLSIPGQKGGDSYGPGGSALAFAGAGGNSAMGFGGPAKVELNSVGLAGETGKGYGSGSSGGIYTSNLATAGAGAGGYGLKRIAAGSLGATEAVTIGAVGAAASGGVGAGCPGIVIVWEYS